MKDTFNLRQFIAENKKSVNEIDTEPRTRPDKGLRVSMGPNAEQEQIVIDIAKRAIALMDEQPDTNAVDALNAVIVRHIED